MFLKYVYKSTSYSLVISRLTILTIIQIIELMGKVKSGENAIVFVAKDYLGNELSLASYKGKKVLLGFYRGTACPFCLGRVKRLLEFYEELKSKGINVIVIIPAKQESIFETSKKTIAPFPIIADPEKKIFKQYGIIDSKFVILKAMVKPFKMMKVMLTNPFSMKLFEEASMLPAEILINGEFKIDIAHYGNHLGDHIPLQKILNK